MKSLKVLLTFVTMFLVAGFVNAQTKTVWKEKTEFHKVMSQTFHPAEEGNYAPIRNRINELVEKADAFKNSQIPAEFTNQKAIKSNLKKLAKQTKTFRKKINTGATDEQLKDDFMALHDTFHQVVGLCTAEDNHDEH